MSGNNTFTYKGKRGYSEIELGGNIHNLVELVNSGKPLAFEVTAITKTQLSVELFVGNITLTANFKIDGFKLAEKTSYNYFSSTHQVNNYFKLTKKQGQKELEQYLMKIIEEISKSVDLKVTQTDFTIHCNGFEF